MDLALEHRESKVRVLALANLSGKRVLRIQPSDERRIRLDRREYVFARWDTALAELAR